MEATRSIDTTGAPQRQPRLIATVFKCYRENFLLFWGIMAPVAIVALILYIAVILSVTQFHIDNITDKLGTEPYKITSNAGTDFGTSFIILLPKMDDSVDSSDDVLVNPIFPPGERSWYLLPFPIFATTNSEGITWKWRSYFRNPSYGYKNPLSLLLLTFCPLSLAIAYTLRRSDVPGAPQNLAPPTAREVWRQTGRKAFTVLGALLLSVLILNVIKVIGDYVTPWLTHLMSQWIGRQMSFELTFALSSIPSYYLFIIPTTYFLVTMSLYNPCLILENNSIIKVFRRSHALVRGVRWRFLGIYLLTGWITSVISSVLTGVALLMFSVFIPDLAVVREALSPLKFLTLFIGADIQVVLPQLLSVPTSVAIHIVTVPIAIFLVPIWAILTTHLYLERAAAQQSSLKT